MEFILTIAVVVLFIMVLGQKQKITAIEKTLARFKPVKKTVQQTTINELAQENEQVVDLKNTSSTKDVIVSVPNNDVQKSIKTESISFETLLVKKIMPALGVLSLVLGVGFLVTWSYSNGYLGPKGLIALGVVFSLSVVVTGELLRPKFPKYFAYLSSAGMLGLAVCVYASEVVYGFISSGTAFAAYIGIVAASFGLALRYDSRIMSVLTATGAFIVPFILNAPESSPYIMMVYGSVLFVAGAAIMRLRIWLETTLVTLAVLMVYAILMLDYVGNIASEFIVNPMVYLLWIYGAAALFVYAITSALVSKEVKQSIKITKLNSSVVSTVAILVAVLSVNYIGYRVFNIQEWNYFGFFVLVQSAVLYVIAEVMRRNKLHVFEQLFTLGTLVGVACATIWELGFADYPAMTCLLLLAQSVLYVYARERVEEQVKIVVTALALATQVVATVALFEINNFGSQSFVFAAAAAVAAYHAWVRACNDTNTVLVSIQTVVSYALVITWTFGYLTMELPGSLQVIIPQLLGLLYVCLLLEVTCGMPEKYRVIAAQVTVVTSALSFVLESSSFDPKELIGFGLVLATMAAFAGFVYKRNSSITTDGYDSKLLRFATLAIAVWTFYFAYWALQDPLTSIVIMAAGLVYVIVGLNTSMNVIRIVGLCLVGYVLAKLYLYDVWSWSTLWRFVAMLPMGLLLISLPFWYQKLKKD